VLRESRRYQSQCRYVTKKLVLLDRISPKDTRELQTLQALNTATSHKIVPSKVMMPSSTHTYVR
jgi:hypothetical protein